MMNLMIVFKVVVITYNNHNHNPLKQENPDNVGSPYWNLLSVEVTRMDDTHSTVTG